MKSKLSLLFFLLSLSCFAQFSKTHYIPPISCSSSQIPEAQYLYISCPSTTPVNFKIIPLGGTTIYGTVSRDNPFELKIGTGNSQIIADQSQANQILSNKGYVIEADDLVYASVRVAAQYHAGSVVSKGLAALGTQFRIGGLLNLNAPSYGEAHYTFASILATENNTTVSFSDIRAGVQLVNNTGVGNNPPNIVLNSGESFIIAVQGPNNANRDGLIGALISSDKPIAVNCGSLAGSNSATSNLDFGLDQIVSQERTGTEYILIKGSGFDPIEKPLIIAHKPNTKVYINGNSTEIITLQAGDYLTLDGTNFTSNNNLYIKTSEKVFVYQAIGGADEFGDPSNANQNMHFVPPLSCETPKIINNIPLINQVGFDSRYIGTVCLVTKTGANLNFIINGNNYTLSNLNTININYTGPQTVSGNTDYETYILTGLTGNISVFSTDSIYLSYYGSSGAATYGGFYSGFTFEPEIAFNKINLTVDNCIPNIKLVVNNVTAFDQFQWYLNENPIIGATTNVYSPTTPGYYHVKATISACGKSLESDRIPVSDCPTNIDNDSANDNIDIDNDNDGITNCVESFGNQIVNTSVSSGIIPNSSITYNTSITNSTPTAATPFSGNSDGSFVTDLLPGKQNYVSYNVNFPSQPANIGLEYPASALASDLINADAEYVINCDFNKTITVLNPDNQLLIDTNYDGIYESGVTQFSSFEIRFRLNGSTPLAAGSGTFKFLGYQISNFKITHKNLSDTAPNKSTFKFFAVCVPRDSDSDGNPDQLDNDSDNDGILDIIEAQSDNPVAISNNDTNGDGLDNAFEPGFNPVDTDTDGVADYLDLDSDNDGILDATEKDIDTDIDGIKNYRDLDSDNDQCFDVKEAGFIDIDIDGLLGTSPVTINPTNGLVTSGVGYTTPNSNYTISAPVTVTTQPIETAKCLEQNASFSLVTNADFIVWQLSTDNGITWNDLTDNAIYSGTTTNNITITGLTTNMSGNLFRAKLNRTGNSCDFYSNNAKLEVYPLPILKSGVRNVQCDDDTDGKTIFNLTQKESELSTNYTNETFDYFLTENDAQTNAVGTKINNKLQYPNATAFTQTIWVRVTNAITGCFEVVSMQLIASTSNAILNNYSADPIAVCDDYIDAINDDNDGISKFDLSQIVTDINALLPNPNYSFSFYKNYADFLQETDANGNSLAITNLTDYRNIGYPNTQTIWVRLEDSNTNDCVGSTNFQLVVEARPVIDMNTDGADNTHICTDDPSVYQTLTSGLPDNAILSNYTFVWYKDGVQLPNTTATISVNQEGDYKVVVSFVAGQKCSRERNIKVEISNTAQIVGNPIIKDLVANNSISVSVTGSGNYVFALDDQYGQTQTTGYFDNIPPGEHTVYVLDLYGCAVLKVPFTILGFPKFFTPNGDGYHDYWNIIGTSTTFYPNTIIYVFDRFGRLLKEIAPLGDGWDGTFVGQPLPADDYWYSAQLQDGRTAKGHFTLKR